MRSEGRRVHRLLARLGLTLATAESCTGGWIAKLLTDHSGSSTYFKGGAVVYSNSAKRRVLRIPIPENKSAVTERIAVRMAQRALALFDADLAVATTGYMEPEPECKGAFARKRITGKAYVAVAFRRNAKTAVHCERLFLRGTRRQNRDSTSTAALLLIEKKVAKEFARELINEGSSQ